METLVLIIIILIISALRNAASQMQQRRNRVPKPDGQNDSSGRNREPTIPDPRKQTSETSSEMRTDREMSRDRKVMREREIGRDREMNKESGDSRKDTGEQQSGLPDINLPEGFPEIPGIPFGEAETESPVEGGHVEDYSGEIYREDGSFIDDKLKNYRDKQKTSKHKAKKMSARATKAYKDSYKRTTKSKSGRFEPSELLQDSSDLKRAIVLTEILGRPKSKRHL